jgi:hypothetical protein
VPLCLPRFNNTGFLHAHVSYVDEACSSCLLLITNEKDSFYELQECRTKIVQTLSSNGCLAEIARVRAFFGVLPASLSLSLCACVHVGVCACVGCGCSRMSFCVCIGLSHARCQTVHPRHPRTFQPKRSASRASANDPLTKRFFFLVAHRHFLLTRAGRESRRLPLEQH